MKQLRSSVIVRRRLFQALDADGDTAREEIDGRFGSLADIPQNQRCVASPKITDIDRLFRSTD